jgi:primary-amine oxidase
MIKRLNLFYRLTISIIIFINICLEFSNIVLAEEAIIPHPLNPLTEQEINTAVTIVKEKKKLSETAIFPIIALQEPDKEAVLNFTPGKSFLRQVFLQVYEIELNKTFTGTVNLNTKNLTSWQEIPHGQPAILNPECHS